MSKTHFATTQGAFLSCERKVQVAKRGETMKNFIKCAAVRAVKTVCQTAIGVIGASAVMSEVDWAIVGSELAA